MIKVKKGPKPEILKKNATTWTKKYCDAVKKWKKTKKGRKPSAKYNQKSVKNGVIKESHDKCVFCESKISHVYHGDIEHFRPKSRFCRYTHTWSNLLFSCRICNGAKSNNFPKPTIIKPTKEDPEKFFEYEALPNGNSVRLVPLNARAENSIRTMKLNREELTERRGERFSELNGTVEILRQYGVPESVISDQVDPYKKDSKEFAGMVRYFF